MSGNKRRRNPKAAESRTPLKVPEADADSQLISIWKEVLHLDEVDRGQTFFDLGGTSISAIQIMARVRDSFGVNVSIAMLFDANASTFDRISQYVELVRWGTQNDNVKVTEDMNEISLA